ncbi:MAG: insulinase family protein, partial [Planctomycetes bacterium]|nr:insulinase family protein [Planctomycetota bacterium]
MTVLCALWLGMMLGGLAAPPEPQFQKLPNGLRICVVEDETSSAVGVQLWFRVGSGFDPPTRPGLTHLTRALLAGAAAKAAVGAGANVEFSSETLRDACVFSLNWTEPPAQPATSSAPAMQAGAQALDRLLQVFASAFEPPPTDRERVQSAAKACATAPPDIDPRLTAAL